MTETDLLQHLIDACTLEAYIQGFGWYKKQFDGYMVQITETDICKELLNIHFKDENTLLKTAEIRKKNILSAEHLFRILRSQQPKDCFGKFFFEGQDTQGVEHLSKVRIPLVECDTTPCEQIVSDWYAQKPRLLQQIGGYILFSPDNRFQKVFLIHGPSANGKGTFLRVLTTILEQKVEGERLSFAVNFDEFTPAERVNLIGKQLIYDAELSGSPKSARWVKLLSGGDKITARALYKSQVTFLPTCKIVLLSNPIPDWGNHPPLIRRLVLLNFKKTFPIDPAKELSYMTDDMLKRWVWYFKQGYDDLCQNGFDLIKENVADEFLSQADNLSLFLQERCEFKSDAWIPTATLYQAFKEFWTDLEDHKPMPNMREVGKRLHEYGVNKDRNVTLKDEDLKRFHLWEKSPEMVEEAGKAVAKQKKRWDIYKGIGLKEN